MVINTFEKFIKKETGKNINELIVGAGFIESYRRCWKMATKTIEKKLICPKCNSKKTWSSNWKDFHGCDDCGWMWGKQQY